MLSASLTDATHMHPLTACGCLWIRCWEAVKWHRGSPNLFGGSNACLTFAFLSLGNISHLRRSQQSPWIDGLPGDGCRFFFGACQLTSAMYRHAPLAPLAPSTTPCLRHLPRPPPFPPVRRVWCNNFSNGRQLGEQAQQQQQPLHAAQVHSEKRAVYRHLNWQVNKTLLSSVPIGELW